MDNKKDINAIVIIICILAVTGILTTWRISSNKLPETKIGSDITQNYQTNTETENINKVQNDLPIINLNKYTKEENGKRIVHVAVEYSKNAAEEKKVIHEFTHDEDFRGFEPTESISYLSKNYLVVLGCSGMCIPTLFDLRTLKVVPLDSECDFGDISFFENEKYIVFKGIGPVACNGLSVEMIDGKKTSCQISEGDIIDVNVKEGVMKYSEYALLDGQQLDDNLVEKEINIDEFCRNK